MKLRSIAWGVGLCVALICQAVRGGTVLVRPDVTRMTETQRTNFVRCVLWMKSNPSMYDPGAASGLNAYDWLVKLHNDGFATHLSGGSGVHMAPSFFPWHREFLRAFERELARAAKSLGIADTVVIPYWDWTNTNAVPVVFSERFMGGNGGGPNSAFTAGPPNTRSTPFRVASGPFGTRDDRTSDFMINTSAEVSGNSSLGAPRVFLQRAISTHQIFGGPALGGAPPPAYPDATQITNLPPADQIATAMAMEDFDREPWDYTVEINLEFPVRTTFRNYMEGHTGLTNFLAGDPFGDQLHGRVHLWVNGNMGSSSSPNDPVFWLHHANLDRIWAEWQDAHGIYNYPAQWYYMDTNSQAKAVVASEMLWRFYKGTNYVADVTSLDTLDIRATGVRYDTQAENAPASLLANLERSGEGLEVRVTAKSIPGLRYHLLGSSDASGGWKAVGSPVIASSEVVEFRLQIETLGALQFLRMAVTATGNPEPIVLTQAQRAAWTASLKDPVCGIPVGGWPESTKR